MKHTRSMKVLAAAVALVLGGVAGAAPVADRAATEKELAAARARLDAAAREVASLSQQLYGDGLPGGVAMMHGGRGPQGAMLGVNIGGEQARDDGVQVMGVSPSGPAQAAGLKAGDVIVAVDGKSLKRSGDVTPSRALVDYMRAVKPGQVVKVDYLRDGKRQSAAVTATEARPPIAMILRERMGMLPGLAGRMPPELMDFMGFGHAFGSLELAPVSPKLGQYFGTDRGLLVVRAGDDDAFKLEDGDVILAIDGRVPENPGHAFRILGSYQPGEKVKLDVLRNRKRMTVEGVLPQADELGGPHGPAAPHPPRPAAPANPVPPPPPPPKATDSA